MELADDAGSASDRASGPAGWLPARQLWLPVAVGVLVLLLDQFTKFLIRGWIGPGASSHRVDFVGRLVGFAYVQNPGAAFGILRGQTAFLILATCAVVALLLLSLHRASRRSPLMYVGVGLLLGGALGNLIDRIRLGYVTDFIAVGIWPKFNVADSAITIGLVLMAWSYLIQESGRGRAIPSSDEESGGQQHEVP